MWAISQVDPTTSLIQITILSAQQDCDACESNDVINIDVQNTVLGNSMKVST